MEKWRSKNKVPLIPVDAKNCLEFTRCWLRSPFDNWAFSDECSVQRTSTRNSLTRYVFRLASKAYCYSPVDHTSRMFRNWYGLSSGLLGDRSWWSWMGSEGAARRDTQRLSRLRQLEMNLLLTTSLSRSFRKITREFTWCLL